MQCVSQFIVGNWSHMAIHCEIITNLSMVQWGTRDEEYIWILGAPGLYALIVSSHRERQDHVYVKWVLNYYVETTAISYRERWVNKSRHRFPCFAVVCMDCIRQGDYLHAIILQRLACTTHYTRQLVYTKLETLKGGSQNVSEKEWYERITENLV